MRPAAGALLAAWLGAAAVSAGLARADGVSDCAPCHETEAALAAESGGHASGLDCAVCHEDRRPGKVGDGHRSTPTSCTSHHAEAVETHPAPTHALGPARLRRRCLVCHDPHGSPNAHLIRSAIRTGGHLRAVEFHDAGGAVAGGFVDPARPGRGLCEICHRKATFYPASGHGQSHFTADCVLCHDHGAAFRAVVSDANCAVCHADEAARLAETSLHHDDFTGRCSACHAEVSPDPGPGHRATSACADCHAAERFAPHVPPGVEIPCTGCHDPHGSDNRSLVREVVHTTQGSDVPIRFDDLSGAADGSFASTSAPGTGLCEVCHTRTQFYRADGTGVSHYTDPCIRCHPHAAGFAPQ